MVTAAIGDYCRTACTMTFGTGLIYMLEGSVRVGALYAGKQVLLVLLTVVAQAWWSCPQLPFPPEQSFVAHEGNVVSSSLFQLCDARQR